MKVAVVGGGSTYTPELVDGMARLAGRVGVSELMLVDPDSARLDVVGPFSARIMRAAGHPAQVRWTTALDVGLDGAGAVLLQLRVGGQAARQRDETWPLEYGCVGQETTGAGGLAKALRTVPVVLDIAERARRRAAAGAWIIDFTNPVGIVTRALLDDGHRALGLCNVAIGLQRRLASRLGVAPQRVRLDHVGLNHLSWVRRVLVDGVDRLPELLADPIEVGLPAELMRTLRAIPSYYLRYYYSTDDVLRDGSPRRAEQVMEIERQLLAMYADPALDHKPALLDQRGGAYYSEAAAALVTSLLNGDGALHYVDLRNSGTITGLPDDAVVEVPATVDRTGAHAEPIPPLAPELLGLVQALTAYEVLTIEAARSGDRRTALRALLAHPLVRQWEIVVPLLDAILEANRAYLPRFAAVSAGS
jgi:6-phospho-beta-glucosidase